MKLTLGFACFDDYLGVWPTIQANRMLHADVMRDVEILVVDNHPSSAHGQMTRDLCRHVADGGQACRYVPMEHPTGTSGPRDRVFREAAGEVVLCIDSHVLLPAGSLRRTLDWFDANPGCRDLIGGPVLYDNFRNVSTHFNDVWRNEMRGVWGQAYECGCGGRFTAVEEMVSSPLASVRETPTGRTLYRTLVGQEPLTACKCGKALPTLMWSGHERVLEAAGYRLLGGEGDEPFEVFAWGLGLFGCRKDAWLGFPPQLRGWGGEECHIHEKYRQAGAKCMILPWLRWAHRFGNPYGHADARPRWHRIRNYIIWHAHLGLDYGPLCDHFGGKVNLDEWNQLIADPLNPPEWPTGAQVAAPPAGCSGCGEGNAPSNDLATWLPQIGPHAPVLQELMQGRHVADSQKMQGVKETELLFIGWCRTTKHLSDDFCAHSSKAKRMAVYGVAAHTPLWSAVGNFLHHEKAWFVTHWVTSDGGFIVLSRVPEERPAEPIHLAPPGYGPGTELRAMLKELGVVEKPNCQCTAKANEMDMGGVGWCRRNRDAIVTFLKAGAESFGWGTVIGAGWRSLTSGLLWSIGVTDPMGGLVDEAIRRAEEKDRQRKAAAP